MCSMMTYEDIKAFFKKIDNNKDELENELVYDTEKGIFGTTNIDHVYSWLSQLDIQSSDTFMDLGSGDGRVCIVADLFCNSKGIEFDQKLVDKSLKYCSELQSNADIQQGDYENANFDNVDILFCYADHKFSEALVTKLQEQFTGTLYVYQGTYFPNGAVKGKTIWVEQAPFLTYSFEKPLNIKEN